MPGTWRKSPARTSLNPGAPGRNCRDMLGLATNPIPIKAAMKLLGRDTGELRLPMTPLDSASEGKLRKTLTNYGLL